jgi:hypothetical protein
VRRIAALFGALLFVAGCSGGSNSFGRLASSEASIGTGEQRLLVAVIDVPTSEMIATPDVTPTAVLRDDIGSPLGEYDGEFLWTIPDVVGLYAFYVDIPGPATYQLTIDAGELGELSPIGFVASADPLPVTVGESAPLSESRTLDDAPLDDLTSDPTPDESFYEMTVAEAVESGPSVLVFATPAWCTSQSCGPMLDQVQEMKAEYPDLNYVHVEIYENVHVAAREDLVVVPPVEEWGLPSEPWLYVTDGSGTVTAAFEGALSDEELRRALDAVAG